MLPVKSFPYLPLLALAYLSCFMPPLVMADDTAESINAMLKAGKEVAWIVAGDEGHDEGLAVLFTSRAKGSKPAAFPYLVTGDVRPADTDALGGYDEVKQVAVDNRTTENTVVSLKEKRVLGRLSTGTPDDDLVYFPGHSNSSLDALWGPNAGGSHLGVVNFGGKWGSHEVLLIETDGKQLGQTSIKSLLDAKARAYLTTTMHGVKDFNAELYAIGYDPQSVVDPGTPNSAGSPVTVKIGFAGQIPKSDADEIDATMTVRLETTKNKLRATVLKVEAAPAP